MTTTVHIRPMTCDDISAGLRLCRLSLWNQVEDDWRYFLDSPGSGGWVAEKHGAVVGTVVIFKYGPSFSWLSMMLVDAQQRRAGIGKLLIEAALDVVGDSCVRLDATSAGEPLYQRYGFVPEYDLVRAAVTVAADRFPQPRRNVRPMAPCDLAEVCASDYEIFGADRSALLASFYRRAPELAWVGRADSGFLGYSFGRPGYLYHQLGPIVGESRGIAQDLVAGCLCGLNKERIAVDVPRFAPSWIEWLKSMGFEIERPFLRMRRGETRFCDLPDRQFAIAGPEFG